MKNFILTILALLLILNFAKAECDQKNTGYDCDDAWQPEEITGVVLSYTLFVVLVVYVVIRLAIEEKNRYTLFTKNLNDAIAEGAKYGITIEQIEEREREIKKREDEQFKFK